MLTCWVQEAGLHVWKRTDDPPAAPPKGDGAGTPSPRAGPCCQTQQRCMRPGLWLLVLCAQLPQLHASYHSCQVGRVELIPGGLPRRRRRLRVRTEVSNCNTACCLDPVLCRIIVFTAGHSNTHGCWCPSLTRYKTLLLHTRDPASSTSSLHAKNALAAVYSARTGAT
jgi:hypothetical protein